MTPSPQVPLPESALVADAPALWTDEEVVERVLQGETDRYEIIMRRYNQRLFRIVRGIVGNDHDAEDVLQDAYVSAYEHLYQFAGRSKFSSWLTKIAVHQALGHRRRGLRTMAVDFNDPQNAPMIPLSSSTDGAKQASLGELRHVLADVVDTLPEELRIVLVMRLVEEINTAETAECLDLTEANVKVRLHRARALVRDRIDAQIGAEVRRLYQFGGERCDRIVRAVLARLSQTKLQP